jgi:hypothetical protein
MGTTLMFVTFSLTIKILLKKRNPSIKTIGNLFLKMPKHHFVSTAFNRRFIKLRSYLFMIGVSYPLLVQDSLKQRPF